RSMSIEHASRQLRAQNSIEDSRKILPQIGYDCTSVRGCVLYDKCVLTNAGMRARHRQSTIWLMRRHVHDMVNNIAYP
ncbi:GH25301, partial [Drosophila grimshawi]